MFTRILLLLSILLCLTPVMGQNSSDSITEEIKDVANDEKVPNDELEKAYIAFQSAYYYGKEFDFEGSDSFGEVAEKQMKIVSRLKYVKNDKLSDATYKVLEKYEDLDFTRENKSKYADDCRSIAQGILEAME